MSAIKWKIAVSRGPVCSFTFCIVSINSDISLTNERIRLKIKILMFKDRILMFTFYLDLRRFNTFSVCLKHNRYPSQKIRVHRDFIFSSLHFALCFAAVKGLNSHQPGHSCKGILDSGDSRGDGEYWIDPEKSGNSLKVFCDMTTDGGKMWWFYKINESKRYNL